MAKKNLQAAAADTFAEMTQAQKMVKKQGTKNTSPFTVWTTPENTRRWKAYQKAKKATLPTQGAFIEAAVLEYMTAHPVTDEEKAELLKSLEI